MWKLGLRPRYSFSGNICFKFSAFCLCSADSHIRVYHVHVTVELFGLNLACLCASVSGFPHIQSFVPFRLPTFIVLFALQETEVLSIRISPGIRHLYRVPSHNADSHLYTRVNLLPKNHSIHDDNLYSFILTIFWIKDLHSVTLTTANPFAPSLVIFFHHWSFFSIFPLQHMKQKDTAAYVFISSIRHTLLSWRRQPNSTIC